MPNCNTCNTHWLQYIVKECIRHRQGVGGKVTKLRNKNNSWYEEGSGSRGAWTECTRDGAQYIQRQQKSPEHRSVFVSLSVTHSKDCDLLKRMHRFPCLIAYHTCALFLPHVESFQCSNFCRHSISCSEDTRNPFADKRLIAAHLDALLPLLSLSTSSLPIISMVAINTQAGFFSTSFMGI